MESFNGKLRDELLDRDFLHVLREAQVLTGRSKRSEKGIRPHGTLGYRPPAAILPAEPIAMRVRPT